jgi:hypothetical protein
VAKNLQPVQQRANIEVGRALKIGNRINLISNTMVDDLPRNPQCILLLHVQSIPCVRKDALQFVAQIGDDEVGVSCSFGYEQPTPHNARSYDLLYLFVSWSSMALVAIPAANDGMGAMVILVSPFDLTVLASAHVADVLGERRLS